MGHSSVIPIFARRAKRFLGCDRGAALVEFALALPLMLVFFATIVEGSRIMWSYQTAIAGVRDASRYLARVVPANVCTFTGGDVTNWTTNGYVSGWESDLTQMVSTAVAGGQSVSLFPADVTVVAPVTPAYICDSGAFRDSPVAIGQVSAKIKIKLPFSSLLHFFGGNAAASIDTTLRNQSRIYGS